MYLTDVNNLILTPALDLLSEISRRDMNGPEARIMLLAIGLQESRFTHRRQISGPARSFWQFERSGGVRGVMRHHASRGFAQIVCDRLGFAFNELAVYDSMENNDILAACFARLLLWTDASSLPSAGDEDAAWRYYIRNWRPGKPHPGTWPSLYQRAIESVGMGAV